MQIDRRIAALCLVAVVLGAAVSAKKSGDGDAKNASGVVKNETLEGTSELSESAAKLLALEKLTPRLEEGVPLFEKPQPLYYVKVNMADADFFLFELLGEEQIGTISVHVHSQVDYSQGGLIKNQVTDNKNIFFVNKKTLVKACHGDKGICYLEVKMKLNNEESRRKVNMFALSSQSTTIQIQEVIPLLLPSPTEDGYTIEFKPTKIDTTGISIHIINRFSQILATAKLSGESNLGQDTEKRYLTGDLWTNILHIPYKDLNEFRTQTVTLYLAPADAAKSVSVSDDQFTSSMTWVEVQIATSTKLISNSKPMEGFVKKDGFSYFIMKKREKDTAVVTLTVLEGESDLYISKGNETYPDTNSFYLRSANLRDDEINLPKTSNEDKYENFVIGVYGVSNSKFRLVVNLNTNYKLYNVKPGEILKKNVKRGDSILLSIDVLQGLSELYLGFSGETGAVKAIAKYHDQMKESFVDNIPTSQNSISLGTTKIAGLITRVKIPGPPKGSTNAELLIRIEPVDSSQDITAFVVFGKDGSVVQMKGGQKLSDELAKGNTQTYMFQFDYDIMEEKLAVELTQGEVKLTISDMQDVESDPAPVVYNLASKGHTVTQDVELYKDKAGNKEIGLFKTYYVKVTAKENSAYSLQSRKSGSEFKSIVPNTFTIFTYDPKKLNAFYYRINPTGIESIKLIFELKNPHFYPQNNNAYEMFSDQSNLIAHTDIYYLAEEDFGIRDSMNNNRVQANIISKEEVEDADRKYVTININVMKGYLIIRPKQQLDGVTNPKKPFKVAFQLSLNSIKAISPNTRTMGKISTGKTDVYQMMVTQGSVANIQVSMCTGSNLTVTVKNDEKRIESGPAVISMSEEKKATSTLTTSVISGEGSKLFYISVTDNSVKSKYGLGEKETKDSKDAKDVPTTYAIKTTTTKFDDMVGLRNYFLPPNKYMSDSGVKYPMIINQDPDEIHYSIKPVFPTGDFATKYPEVKKIEMEFLVYISNENPKIFEKDNICDVELFANRNSYYWTKKAFIYTRLSAGTFDFTPKGFNLTMGYPKTSLPYYGVVQITARFYQEDLDEVSNDASLMIKIPFKITSRPRKPIVYFIMIFMLIGFIGVAVFFFLKYTKNAVEDRIKDRGNFHYQSASADSSSTNIELS